MIPPDARRILVVRLSARGDVVLSSPLAGALRCRCPAAHIAWAVEERTADVIRHNPHLDEVIVWERAEWKRLLRTGRWGAFLGAAADFFGALRDRRFEVAIDAQGLLRSGALAFLSGAPVRIGLGSREGSRLLMTKVVKREFFTRRIASADAAFARALGLDTASFRMEIPRGGHELAAVDRIVEEGGLGDGFVAAVPFTTRFYKHWFEDRWSALIRQIRERAGLGVVLLGGPADRAAADRILEGAANGSVDGAPLVDLVGRTTLGEASAVVSRCSALVGVDTGLSHMAHAFGRPAVLIFGSNAPYLDPPTPAARILHSGRDCSPCWGRLTCGGRIDCMDDIPVAEVLAAVRTAVA
ncbi:MAG: glycosyltransferase family 9 protein [Gemmatimonadota bacterium]|nr:glycosyltransferase family 9 protein [Gemmatimonadota bacterium]MDE2986331.1 glycosyltransferase family 9 protein [Gemmatimonadota bacterium]